MLDGDSGSVIDSRPRAAERTAIKVVGGAASSDATAPEDVIGQAIDREGVAQPVERERQENGGGVDVCDGVLEGLIEGVGVDEGVNEGLIEGAGAGVTDEDIDCDGDRDGEGMHALIEIAPVVMLSVSAGQGVAFTEDSGQYDPIGQMSGAPDEQK